MHTTKTLSSTDFIFTINGQQGILENVFPEFNKTDRIGIVVRRPGGGIGACALLMAAITRFYDFYRPLLGNEPNKLRIYPDFFIFHIGKRHMNYYWFDIWPQHKEVITEENPESILEAINDRGITRLLVEDTKPLPYPFLRETISSAEHRIVSALAYSPTGKVENGDVYIKSSAAIEKYIASTLELSKEITEEEKMRIGQERKSIISNQCAIESYRRINQSEAIFMLI